MANSTYRLSLTNLGGLEVLLDQGVMYGDVGNIVLDHPLNLTLKPSRDTYFYFGDPITALRVLDFPNGEVVVDPPDLVRIHKRVTDATSVTASTDSRPNVITDVPKALTDDTTGSRGGNIPLSELGADHVHPHGDLGGDTLHAVVDSFEAGFMSPAMLADLDALVLAGPGVTDHGALSGLSDDDHPQYLLAVRAQEFANAGDVPVGNSSDKIDISWLGGIGHGQLSSGLKSEIELFDRGDGSDGTVSTGSDWTTQIWLYEDLTVTASIGINSSSVNWLCVKCTGTLTVNTGCNLNMNAVGSTGGTGTASNGGTGNTGSNASEGETNAVLTGGTAGTGGGVGIAGGNGSAGSTGGSFQAGSCGGSGGGGGGNAAPNGNAGSTGNAQGTTRGTDRARFVFNPSGLSGLGTYTAGNDGRGGSGGGSGGGASGGAGGTGRQGGSYGRALHLAADTIVLSGTATISANGGAAQNANAASNGSAGGGNSGGGGGAGGAAGGGGGHLVIHARVFTGTATATGGAGGTGGTGGAAGAGTAKAGGNGATGGNGGAGIVDIQVWI